MKQFSLSQKITCELSLNLRATILQLFKNEDCKKCIDFVEQRNKKNRTSYENLKLNYKLEKAVTVKYAVIFRLSSKIAYKIEIQRLKLFIMHLKASMKNC